MWMYIGNVLSFRVFAVAVMPADMVPRSFVGSLVGSLSLSSEG